MPTAGRSRPKGTGCVELGRREAQSWGNVCGKMPAAVRRLVWCEALQPFSTSHITLDKKNKHIAQGRLVRRLPSWNKRFKRQGTIAGTSCDCTLCFTPAYATSALPTHKALGGEEWQVQCEGGNLLCVAAPRGHQRWHAAEQQPS